MPRREDRTCQYGLSYSRGSTKLHIYEKTASICVNAPPVIHTSCVRPTLHPFLLPHYILGVTINRTATFLLPRLKPLSISACSSQGQEETHKSSRVPRRSARNRLQNVSFITGTSSSLDEYRLSCHHLWLPLPLPWLLGNKTPFRSRLTSCWMESQRTQGIKRQKNVFMYLKPQLRDLLSYRQCSIPIFCRLLFHCEGLPIHLLRRPDRVA